MFERNSSSEAYRRWLNMMERCYNINAPNYKWYGAKGVTVEEYFHDYQKFAEWYEANKIAGCQMDKDILCKKLGIEPSIYARHTITFIPASDNLKQQAHNWTFLSPKGEVTEIYNLEEFCRNNGLDSGAMNKVAKGTRKSHKGWKNV
jgi:hypothetical protein